MANDVRSLPLADDHRRVDVLFLIDIVDGIGHGSIDLGRMSPVLSSDRRVQSNENEENNTDRDRHVDDRSTTDVGCSSSAATQRSYADTGVTVCRSLCRHIGRRSLLLFVVKRARSIAARGHTFVVVPIRSI
jgi:hypothetical protein